MPVSARPDMAGYVGCVVSLVSGGNCSEDFSPLGLPSWRFLLFHGVRVSIVGEYCRSRRKPSLLPLPPASTAGSATIICLSGHCLLLSFLVTMKFLGLSEVAQTRGPDGLFEKKHH
ncbi:hypothetical protein Ancab_012324 [Ancistrocladus abbreviatus]